MAPIRSLLLLLVSAPLAAQTALVTDATVRASAGGAVVALLKQGTTVTVGASRGGEVFVTFTGWLDGSKLGAVRDSFPAHLTGSIAMRLRSAPSMKGVILGEVRPGAGVFTIGKQASWMNVRRGGWVEAKALPQSAATSAKPEPPPLKPATKIAVASRPVAKTNVPATKPSPTASKAAASTAKADAKAPVAAPPAAAEPASSPDAPVVEPMPEGALRITRSSVVRNAPNGLVIGQIGAGTIVRPLARARGWVRVRADVWVPERDVVPADSTFGASLTAADLRADPEGTRGKTVRWEVQVLALQYADPLRRDLAQDEPYFLAKGPGAEDQLLYLAIPPSLLAEARSTQALTRLLVTARVRTGRSQPVGIPILDILSLARQ